MIAPKKLLKGLLAALVMVPLSLMATPASAAPPADDPEHPWRHDHWPQTQPWQRDAPDDDAQAPARSAHRRHQADRPAELGEPRPHDVGRLQEAVPGTNWADPSAKGSKRTFKGALVLLDYPNQPFVVTQPKGSTVFGNPQRRGPRHPP